MVATSKIAFVAAALALGLVGHALAAESDGSFYEGKQIRLIVSFGAGGGYDIFTRIVGRHLGDHIPGHPSVIVENKPGAGGIIAANALYNTEGSDGTVIGTLPPNVILAQALGTKVQYDSLKFNYLGSGADDFIACVVRRDAAATTLQQAMSTEIPIATQSPGSLSYAIPALLNLTIGTKFKLVPGYRSIPDQFLAVEKNEAAGACQAYASVLLASQRALLEGQKPKAKIMVAVTTDKPKGDFLDRVPTAIEFAKTDGDKAALRAVELLGVISYPYAVGPKVPADRVAILRKALQDTFADPEFLKDAAKAGQQVSVHTGQQVADIANEIVALPQPVIDELKPLLLRH